MRKKVFVFAGHFFWCFAARALGLFLFLSELCMKFFANHAMSSKVVTICVAVVLVTGTHIMLRPAQAFAVEPTFIYSTIFSSIGATLRGLFGRDNTPNRR